MPRSTFQIKEPNETTFSTVMLREGDTFRDVIIEDLGYSTSNVDVYVNERICSSSCLDDEIQAGDKIEIELRKSKSGIA